MDLSPAQSGTDDKILSERIHPVVDQVVIRVPRAPRNGLAQSLQYRRLQLYIALLVMEQKPWDWYWTFNIKAMQRLFGEAFGPANVEVAAHGNAFAATCFIQGIAVEDVGSDWLTPLDETFPVLLTMKATRAPD